MVAVVYDFDEFFTMLSVRFFVDYKLVRLQSGTYQSRIEILTEFCIIKVGLSIVIRMD